MLPETHGHYQWKGYLRFADLSHQRVYMYHEEHRNKRYEQKCVRLCKYKEKDLKNQNLKKALQFISHEKDDKNSALYSPQSTMEMCRKQSGTEFLT